VVVEEREDYETLKYVAPPMGMLTWPAGRSTVARARNGRSALLALSVGWFVLGCAGKT
jgi:hypothetical protein